MYYIEDKHMNCVVCQLFLSLLSLVTQRNFEVELMTNPNKKFKVICEHFWETYGSITHKEAKDNKDRLNTALQLHQGFKNLYLSNAKLA